MRDRPEVAPKTNKIVSSKPIAQSRKGSFYDREINFLVRKEEN